MLKGGKGLLSSSPGLIFLFFNIEKKKKLGVKINVFSKMTHFWADFARLRGAFFSITYLLDFSEGKTKSK